MNTHHFDEQALSFSTNAMSHVEKHNTSQRLQARMLMIKNSNVENTQCVSMILSSHADD